MSNSEMLEKIRLDRPYQTINEVISFEENGDGFFDVLVDMETEVFGTSILHTKRILPYPFSRYDELSEEEKMGWRWNNSLTKV